jgi:hypothetical protein
VVLAQAPEEPPPPAPPVPEPAPPAPPPPAEIIEKVEKEKVQPDDTVETVETTEESHPPRLQVDVEGWVAQPAGTEYNVGTQSSPTDPFGTQLLQHTHGTETEFRIRVGWELPANLGNLGVVYYTHDTSAELDRFDPGNFVFGETLTHPLFAGFNNDGRSDGLESESTTTLRDWHIDYSHLAFRTERVTGHWSVNWRRVRHSRNVDAIYHSVVHDLPPLIPPLTAPRPDLQPLPDTASINSDWEGRGPGVGLDLDFDLWKGKVLFEGGVGLAALRGETSTSYFAQNHLYVLLPLPISDPPFDTPIVLGPPYDEFEGFFVNDQNQLAPLVDLIRQESAGFGLTASNSSSTSQVLETYLGFRWKFLKRYELYGGFRSTRYDDVGLELRPKLTTYTLTEEGTLVMNLQDVEEIERSVTYEGFFLGMTFHLF